MHLLLLLVLASGPDTNYCQVCHSDVKVEYKDSVHAGERIECVDCHGGNSSADTQSAAHSGSFRPNNSRKQITEACASCHSDSRKMKPYGLPTDQMALYATSVHGKRLASGDDRAAICTDCHGVHHIVPPSDPESATHPRNIEQTCGKCHSDADLMSHYKISPAIVSDYQAGVHGKALHNGNHQAPVCTSCHGTHGAAPPGVGDVSIVCGHCHQAVRDYFRAGPHQAVMAAAGIPECSACHGNHKIPPAGEKLWVDACKNCHAENGPEAKRGIEIRNLLTEAQDEITKADKVVEEARKIPIDVSDYEAGLEEARTYLTQAVPVTHSLNVQQVEDLTRHGRSLAVEIQKELKAKQDILQDRRIILIVIWFFILLTIAIIYRYKKQLEAQNQGQE